MTQLTFSVIWNKEQPDYVTALVERFGGPCRTYRMSWDEAWGDLVATAAHKSEIDVSQVAAPWTGNFVAMDALRPFTRSEVAALGGPDAFLPAAWQSTLVGKKKQVWAIPWLTDVRVIFYWRDVFEQAGVDGATAFQTPERVEETCARLAAAGFTPWATPTHSQFLTLHNVVSWIWGAGQELISADGKQVLLTRPQVLASLRSYFALNRYLPPSTRLLTNPDAFRLFTERRVAFTMGPSGWLETVDEKSAVENAGDLVGVALPPGPPYVGGSNLVIWKHTRNAREGIDLVRFLTDKETQVEFAPQVGTPPARVDALDSPSYSTDPNRRMVVTALKSGRSYPTFARWGLVEERISVAFIQIWEDLLSKPDQVIYDVLERYLEPLAQRLEMTLRSPSR